MIAPIVGTHTKTAHVAGAGLTPSSSTSSARPTLAQTFQALRDRGQLALIPFVPAGYPDLETTSAALVALEAAGASVIEVGIPFSDPVADGPIIQEAYTAALSRKLRVGEVFAAVAASRAKVTLPLVSMVSYSVVFRYGVANFIRDARQSGFDGLLLPDLPPPEAQSVCEAVQAGGMDTILLVAPTTTLERRREIARLSSGFVYYLSVSGITGERDQLPADLADNVRQLKGLTDQPVCVGFGISQARHLAQLRGVADGAIVGSALVRRMKSHLNDPPAAIAEAASQFTRELLVGNRN